MKRGHILFFAFIVVCFVVVFLVQYNAPRPFVWKPTFDHADRQPFGCAVFDDVLASSLPAYRVESKTLYQIYETNTDTALLPESRQRSYLIVDEYITLPDSDIATICQLLQQGHNVMLCASDFSDEIGEAFGVTTQYTQAGIYDVFERAVKQYAVRDSIYFGTRIGDNQRPYRVFPQLHPVYLESEYGDLGSAYSRCACDGRNRSLALEVKVDDCEGSLFIVATPLLFTNYGMLDGDNASYIFRMLSLLGRRPLVRLEDATASAASPGLLSSITDEPALHGAFITLLLLVLLLMVNAAQRRQRAIPVVTPPANEMLRFTRLIGNLYYQKRDYKDLLRKKYRYFRADIRRRYGTDLDADDLQETAALLADRMGQSTDEVMPDFLRLKHLLSDEARVTNADMRRSIDRINEWKEKLK